MALSFRRNGDGSFSITIPQQERRLLEELIPQVRELISDHDQLAWRLFPNPYPEHEKAADQYAEMIGDELQDNHLAALATVEATLDAKRLDEDQMNAWMGAVNDVRLVIGTRLKVEEDTEIDSYEDETDQALFLTYSYLGLMLERIVVAIAGDGLDDDPMA
ncbi:MAG: DUF2017 family protein [Actinomycetota bacterium]